MNGSGLDSSGLDSSGREASEQDWAAHSNSTQHVPGLYEAGQDAEWLDAAWSDSYGSGSSELSDPGAAGGGWGDDGASGQPRQARRMAVPVIAGALVIVAVVGFVMVHIVQNAGRPGGFLGSATGSPSQAAGGRSASPSAAASSTPNIPATTPRPKHKPRPSPTTVPAALAGTWAGQAKQAHPADSFAVSVQLAAGSTSAGITYSSPTFSCTGDLSFASDHKHTLVMDQHIVKGSCVNGVVTLKHGPAGTVQFTFKATTGLAATGILTKT